MIRHSTVVRMVAVAAFALATALPADARPGGGFGSGSRGSRTFSAPPSTATAPRTAQPMQRTEAPAVNPAARPGMNAPAAAQPRRFGTGMMAGLLGAGLFGMLLGGGFFGGLSGLGSMLGLLMQVALIGGLIWLALRFFRRRSEPAMAGPAGAMHGRSALGPTPMGGAMPLGGGTAARPAPLQIGPQDFDAFERSLMDIQTAYGREDMNALVQLATPEMARYFSSDLENNRQQGLRNDVSAPKLLQGDLSEAWREGPTDYATVAMRFSIIDTTVERSSGKVVSGDPRQPLEATELWTFRRDRGGAWTLSAIQQT